VVAEEAAEEGGLAGVEEVEVEAEAGGAVEDEFVPPWVTVGPFIAGH